MTNIEQDIIHFKTNHPRHSSEEIAKVFGVSKVHVNCAINNHAFCIAMQRLQWRGAKQNNIKVITSNRTGGLS